jgi:hypothetical protein
MTIHQAIVCVGVLGGCAAEPEMGDTTGAVYATTVRPWRSPSIPVCFDEASPYYAAQMQWIREAVEQTWQLDTVIVFTGWGQCSSNQPGIHVGFGSVAATAGHGPDLDGFSLDTRLWLDGGWLENFVNIPTLGEEGMRWRYFP